MLLVMRWSSSGVASGMPSASSGARGRVDRLAAAPDLPRGARRRALRLAALGGSRALGVSRALDERASWRSTTSPAAHGARRLVSARRAHLVGLDDEPRLTMLGASPTLDEIRASPAIEAARPRAVRVSREAIAPRGQATHSSRRTPTSSSVTLSRASAGVFARRPVSIEESGCRPDRGSILGSPTPRPAEARGSGPPGRRHRDP